MNGTGVPRLAHLSTSDNGERQFNKHNQYRPPIIASANAARITAPMKFHKRVETG
jgi:hypothetical protein